LTLEEGKTLVPYETLLVHQRNDVAYVTLNRPPALNALSSALRRELKQCFADIQASRGVRLVVLTGVGRAFCAGADIKEWREPSSAVEDRQDRQQLNFWEVMSRCEQPIIAAINGYALGGGCELAMCCDSRSASDRAQLGLTEVTLGIIPGGGTQRLPRLIGRGKTLELILTGKRIDAHEALRLGLVEQVVPHDQLMVAVAELA
jgi:enoyl-CoA hydratase/carnithine racemase